MDCTSHTRSPTLPILKLQDSLTMSCDGCEFPIFPPTARGKLASRGVTTLDCNHHYHTLCISIIFNVNREEKVHPCPVAHCGQHINFESIKENLPDPRMLINQSALFSHTYLKPYFPSFSSVESYLQKSPFRNIFFVMPNKSSEETDKLIQILENSFIPLIQTILFTVNFEYYFSMAQKIRGREKSPFHLALSEDNYIKAYEIAISNDINNLKSCYGTLEMLIRQGNCYKILNIYETLDESSQDFFLDLQLLQNKNTNYETNLLIAKMLKLLVADQVIVSPNKVSVDKV